MHVHTTAAAASASPFYFGFASISDAVKFTTFSRAYLYQLMDRGEFPARVPLKGTRKAWRWSDLIEWSKNPEGYQVAGGHHE